jgi:hypothetical protein
MWLASDAGIGDLLGDLFLGQPLKRSTDFNLAVEERREQRLQSTENFGMRGTRGPAAHDIACQGWVDAHNSVLVEAEAVLARHPRDDEAEAREKERAGSLCELDGLGDLIRDPDGNVGDPPFITALFQIADKLFLNVSYLR